MELRARNIIESSVIYDKQPSLRSVPHKLEMDYSQFLGKPFLINTVPWSTSAAVYSSISTTYFPSAFLLNSFLSVPFTHSAYFRAKCRVIMQVAGTPMHQGIILASAQPPSTESSSENLASRLYVNNYMNAPHTFLVANNSAACSVELPFYCASKLMRCDLDSDNLPAIDVLGVNSYCCLDLMVLNALAAPTSGSTTLSITIHVVFDSLEFFVPWSEVSWIPQGKTCECCTSCKSTCTLRLGELFRNCKPFQPQGADAEYWSSWGTWGEQEKKSETTTVAVKESQEVTPAVTQKEPEINVNVQPQSTSIWDRFCSILSTTFDSIAGGAKRVTADFIDLGRTAVREYTGLHNGIESRLRKKVYIQTRVPPNTVDANVVAEKLDPYSGYDRINRDFVFDTSQDEMDLSYLLQKPQFLSTFSVNTVDSTGKILFSRPITMQQEVLLDSSFVPNMTANQHILAYLSRYWRGTINIHIQADMTNFHYCKLAVFKNYSTHKQQLTSVPSYNDVQGLLVDFIEFSSGGQVQTISLPYCSMANELETTRDWVVNSLQHGMYYIYLAQPLVANGTVPQTINFNIFYSMNDDCQLYGYSTDSASIIDKTTFSKRKEVTTDVKKIKEEQKPEVKDAAPPLEEHELHFNISKIAKDLIFTAQGYDMPAENDTDLVETTRTTTKISIDSENHRPLVNMRDLVRRLQPVKPEDLSSAEIAVNNGVRAYRVSDLLQAVAVNSTTSNGVQIARRFYLGMDGGLRVKIKVVGVSNASAIFCPPGSVYFLNGSIPTLLGSTPIVSDSNIALSVTNGSRYLRSQLGNVCPIQESANYLAGTQGTLTASGNPATATNAVASPEMILDIVVPNLSPYRFVGTAAGYLSDSAGITDAANDLGTIVLSVKPAPSGTTTLTYNRVSIQMYISMTDETRLGYQIKSPTLAYPTVVGIDGERYLQTVFQNDYGSISGVKANPRDVALAGYIG